MAGTPGNGGQVKAFIDEQLIARTPTISAERWGDDPLRLNTALRVCTALQEEYGWPNDYFLPADPFEIAIMGPWDDLEIVELMLRLEENLNIEIDDAEIETWTGTLGEVVDFLTAKRQTV